MERAAATLDLHWQGVLGRRRAGMGEVRMSRLNETLRMKPDVRGVSEGREHEVLMLL
jgi:hypothetical protein